MPARATVPSRTTLVLSGRVVGAPDTGVTFQLLSGSGSLRTMSPSTSLFTALSPDAAIRIAASSTTNPALSRTIELAVTNFDEPLFLLPEGISQLPYVLATATTQTFTAAEYLSPFPQGVTPAEFFAWPSGTISSTGLLTATVGVERVYARNPANNVWASTDVDVRATTEASVVITPAVSTTTRGGVVQLTAMTSSGAPVTWRALGGSVTPTGTFTAPTTPGIYLVQASVTSSRYAVATIVVR
jgi:hypothetical protein